MRTMCAGQAEDAPDVPGPPTHCPILECRSEPLIAVSDSSGEITVWRPSGDTLTEVQRWKAHELETWICAFDYYHPDCVYTGADDCLFKGWDMRAPGRPTFVSKR